MRSRWPKWAAWSPASPLRRFRVRIRCRLDVAAATASSHGVHCASECCYVAAYRAVWVTRSGLDVALFLRALPSSATTVPRPLACPGSSSRALRSPPEYLGPDPPLAFRSTAPSLGFLSSSRHQPVESTHPGVPSPVCSALDVSHVPDGLLLHQPLRVCFTPLPRPGFALRGFPLPHSRTSSSPAVALMPFTLAPYRRLPDGAGNARPPTGPCSVCQSVASRGGLAHDQPDPSLSFVSLGFSSACRDGAFGRHRLRSQPFTAHSVLTTCSLTCCCQPASPVRGFRPAFLHALRRGFQRGPLSTKRSASTADGFLYEHGSYQLSRARNHAEEAGPNARDLSFF